MSPANAPRPASSLRVLVVEGESTKSIAASEIVNLFGPGDVIVVNDAATLPASLRAGTVEVRLLSFLGEERWLAALLGEGDFRTRTEDRPPPPLLEPGTELPFGTIEEVRSESPRLVVLGVRGGIETIYRQGRPVQYAHVPEALSLWDVQNVYAGRPWAVEMPSAGRVLRAETILALRERGVLVVALTHAAGISAVGDPIIDAMLPLPERYEVPQETMNAIGRARRVVAIGTSVVRALETVARTGRLAGVTSLRLGPESTLELVDAVLTGVHEADTSHYTLLRAFSPKPTLAHALAVATERKMLGHEFGDALLVFSQAA